MSIKLRQQRYAVVTADAQSCSRAAAALNVRQSTLSRRVLALEHRLGVKLFERTTRRAEPTENSKVFVEQARRIVTEVDNLQTRGRPAGSDQGGNFHPQNTPFCATLRTILITWLSTRSPEGGKKHRQVLEKYGAG